MVLALTAADQGALDDKLGMLVDEVSKQPHGWRDRLGKWVAALVCRLRVAHRVVFGPTLRGNS